MMPAAGDQLTVRVPGAGGEKVNVYWLPEPVTDLAGMPSINKSAASTPRTALVKVTVSWTRLVTGPGGGDWPATRGGAVFVLTVTITTPEVAERPVASVATAVSR